MGPDIAFYVGPFLYQYSDRGLVVSKQKKKHSRKVTTSKSKSHLASQKALCLRKATVKVAENRAKLSGIRALVAQRFDHCDDNASRTLSKALDLAEANLVVAEVWVERLQITDEKSWVEIRDGLDDAWEDFSQALKKIVVRL